MRPLFLLALAFLVLGCVQSGEPAMKYSIRPCDITENDSGYGFNMSASDGIIAIHQKQSYVCCANITLSMKAEGGVLRLYEDNVGEMCRCICPFEADIDITGAQGYERVEVYGIRYKDVQDYELLFNSSVPG